MAISGHSQSLLEALAGEDVLFLSPHLDDAVLSCGGLMGALAAQGNVSVVTVFTEAAPPPHTLAARSFLRQCGAHDAEDLYRQRRAEDRAALERLGVRHVHLGKRDALFRARQPGRLATSAGRLLPELTHRYPTYRFDIARGRVSREDRRCLPRLCAELSRALGPNPPQTVFCPLGVGRHVDHLLVRAMGVMLFPHAVFYADFPYVLRSGVDEEFIRTRRLQRFTWDGGVNRKTEAIREYRSQVQGLFPNGAIPHKPEIYYMKGETSWLRTA